MIIRAGAGAVRQVVKPEILQPVLEAYNKAITATFVRYGYPSIVPS